MAGVIVAIIAPPLSIALALASGVSPEQGIYTAIVAGFVISALGGSQVQIAGPTAAFAHHRGRDRGQNAGRDRCGGHSDCRDNPGGYGAVPPGHAHQKFIPFTHHNGLHRRYRRDHVIGQLKVFFGVTYPAGMPTIETIEKLQAFFAGAGTIIRDAIIVGMVCLLVQILAPKLTEENSRLPAGGSLPHRHGAASGRCRSPQSEISTLLSNALPAFHLPRRLTLGSVQAALSRRFYHRHSGAIESLLVLRVATAWWAARHRSNMELVAQGAGNIASALFAESPPPRHRPDCGQYQKRRPHTRRRDDPRRGAGADSGWAHALCRADPHAHDCGHLFNGGLQAQCAAAHISCTWSARRPGANVAVLVVTFVAETKKRLRNKKKKKNRSFDWWWPSMWVMLMACLLYHEAYERRDLRYRLAAL